MAWTQLSCAGRSCLFLLASFRQNLGDATLSNKLKALRNRAAAITKEQRRLSDEAGEADLSEEASKEYDALSAEMQSVQAAIEREERLRKQEQSLAVIPDNASKPEEKKPSLYPDHFSSFGKSIGFKEPKDAYLSGMFVLSAFYGNERATQWCKDAGVLKRPGDLTLDQLAHSGGVNTAGGYLVPPQLMSAIIGLREQYGVFRRECRVVPMASDNLLIPRRTGGLTAYFVGENSTITESEKTWDQVQLSAKKLGILVKYSSELAEDAVITLASDFAQEIAYSFALKEDQCGFIGDGTSTYGGITGAAVKVNNGNHAGSIYTSATGNTAFDTLDLADFHGLTSKLPQYAKMRAKWYCSSVAYSQAMERLMYAGGGNTVSTIGGGTGPSFLGYPVVISQVLNSTSGAQTNTIILLFGDLSAAATMGDRRSIEIATSTDRYFEADQIAIRGTERFDIVVHDLGDASTAGPLVALKTASS